MIPSPLILSGFRNLQGWQQMREPGEVRRAEDCQVSWRCRRTSTLLPWTSSIPRQAATIASIIDRMRNLSGGGKSNMSGHKAALEVAKEVESIYYHDNIYCMLQRWTNKKVTEMWTNF
jgi:hypothetical protein